MPDQLAWKLLAYVDADPRPISFSEVQARAGSRIGRRRERRRFSRRRAALVVGVALVVGALVAALVVEPGSTRTRRILTPTDTTEPTTTTVGRTDFSDVAPLILAGNDVTPTRIMAAPGSPSSASQWIQVFRRAGDSLAGPVLVVTDNRSALAAGAPVGSRSVTPADAPDFFASLPTFDLGGGRRIGFKSGGQDVWLAFVDLGDGWGRVQLTSRGLSQPELISTVRQIQLRNDNGVELPQPPTAMRQVAEGALQGAQSKTVAQGYLVGTTTPTPDNEIVLSLTTNTSVLLHSISLNQCSEGSSPTTRAVSVRGHAAVLVSCPPPPGASFSTRSTLAWEDDDATTVQLTGPGAGDDLMAIAIRLRADPAAFAAILDRLGTRSSCLMPIVAVPASETC